MAAAFAIDKDTERGRGRGRMRTTRTADGAKTDPLTPHRHVRKRNVQLGRLAGTRTHLKAGGGWRKFFSAP